MYDKCLCGKVEAEEVCLDSDDEDPPPPPSRPAQRIDPPAHRYSRAQGILKNGCGSGSGLDPDSVGSVDPDPDSESGSRRVKMTHKSRILSSCFEVLDGLF